MAPTVTQPSLGRRIGPLHVGDILRLLLSWAVAVLGLSVSVWALPGLTAEGGLPSIVGAALAMGVIGGLIRPLLVAGSVRLGWIGVLLATFFAQAIVVQLSVAVVPGITSRTLFTGLGAGLITGFFVTLATWIGTAGTDEAFLTSLVRRRGHGRRPGDRATVADGLDGIVFVQLDGASYETIAWGVNAGTLPTLSRWVRSGSHRLSRWQAQIPCTTPVSQAGILHGSFKDMPAFRWYDRETGQVRVASKPADMAWKEARLSDGRGLLADGGVSIGNIFSGDAPVAMATMSRLSGSRNPGPANRFARYLTQPNGLFRSVIRAFAELIRERYEAHRQVRRDVQPRMLRKRSFAVVRAGTNGLLRDMSTALVADAMFDGARSIYVDLVDYDEVAHHAGPLRGEALHSLENLDGVLSALEQVAEVSPRRYHFVVLSDHGQSQGETFASRYDEDLGQLVTRLTGEQRFEATGDQVESWGRVDLLRSTVAASSGVAGKVADAGAATTHSHVEPDTPGDESFVVLGSGNLGLIYAREPAALTREDLDHRWPRLISGLVEHPGIGFVVVRSAAGPVVIGGDGEHRLDDGRIERTDPLRRFPGIATDLRRAMGSPDAPDLYVNSALDEGTNEVAAFEELVGCHGGAGGWQTDAVLLAPADWPLPDVIHGADVLHQVLVGWLEDLGQRTELPEGVPNPPDRRLEVEPT